MHSSAIDLMMDVCVCVLVCAFIPILQSGAVNVSQIYYTPVLRLRAGTHSPCRVLQHAYSVAHIDPHSTLWFIMAEAVFRAYADGVADRCMGTSRRCTGCVRKCARRCSLARGERVITMGVFSILHPVKHVYIGAAVANMCTTCITWSFFLSLALTVRPGTAHLSTSAV